MQTPAPQQWAAGQAVDFIDDHIKDFIKIILIINSNCTVPFCLVDFLLLSFGLTPLLDCFVCLAGFLSDWDLGLDGMSVSAWFN